MNCCWMMRGHASGSGAFLLSSIWLSCSKTKPVCEKRKENMKTQCTTRLAVPPSLLGTFKRPSQRKKRKDVIVVQPFKNCASMHNPPKISPVRRAAAEGLRWKFYLDSCFRKSDFFCKPFSGEDIWVMRSFKL